LSHVDGECHRPFLFGKDEHGLHAVCARLAFGHVDQRHQGAAILHHVLAVAVLDGVELDLL
jgi:hypothetical protein